MLLFKRAESPLSFKDYQEDDGFKALRCALSKSQEDIIRMIKASNVVGRGGAGFPVWIKMDSVRKTQEEKKYIICNADEGEPGTFKDRELLYRNPLKVIESMIIAGYTVGADEGYLYVRGEYDYLKPDILRAINQCEKEGYLGDNILDSGFSFKINYRSGSGAYICGEETALIESIEGRTGDPRHKPPYTAQEGLFNKPTLVNNVETLINLLPILNLGPDVYRTYGTESSSGTKLFSVSGCVKTPGVYEVQFGTTLKELIDLAGGIRGDLKVKFVQVGGSSGIVLPKTMLDIALSYESFKAIDSGLGSGAIYVADESVCIVDYLMATSKFFEHESCGKCTPCREGNRHISRIMTKLASGRATPNDLLILEKTSHVMVEASFCGLGQTAPNAILSCLKYFSEEINEHIKSKCPSGVCKLGGDTHVD
jgi:NADH:ubiquinone oxidoreductase subunit F (NADH-binding)